MTALRKTSQFLTAYPLWGPEMAYFTSVSIFLDALPTWRVRGTAPPEGACCTELHGLVCPGTPLLLTFHSSPSLPPNNG